MISFQPIGLIHSPWRTLAEMPGARLLPKNVKGTVEIFPKYLAGLDDLAGFERIWLLFYFDRAAQPSLQVVPPFGQRRSRGVFATRAPCRPNAIGLTCVRLLARNDAILRVAGVEMLDGTPLLDIKPYLPQIDAFPNSQAGWCE